MIPPVIGIHSPPTLGIMGGLLLVLNGILGTLKAVTIHIKTLHGFQKLTRWGVVMIPLHRGPTNQLDLGQLRDLVGQKG